MKIISTATTTLGAWASLVSADRAFDPTESRGDHNMTSIKTAARFGNGGAKIELCSSGDCDNGQLITLSMSRLEEIDNTPKMVQQAKNFNALDASWSDFEPITVVGIDAMSTSFVTNFTVGKAANPTWFNLTATIYADNGTTMNGNQTIDVPAGSLKFSVAIKDWPFSDKANRLQFGVYLKARGKNNADESSMSKKAKGGNHTDIDRVDMGEGMFMDAPTLAVVDGTDKAINSTITVTNKITELVWVFPSFTQTMFYDPVMGSEDTTTTTTTSSTTNTTESPSPTASSTPTPTPTTTSASTPTPTATPTSTPATTSGTTTHLLMSLLTAGILAITSSFVM